MDNQSAHDAGYTEGFAQGVMALHAAIKDILPEGLLQRVEIELTKLPQGVAPTVLRDRAAAVADGLVGERARTPDYDRGWDDCACTAEERIRAMPLTPDG